VGLSEKSVRDLLAAFRSPNPTPGGGSASALAGAVGASLLAMVATLPKTRASSAEDEESLREAGERCAALSDELTTLIDRDSEAYDLVMAAYKRPKNTEQEKAARAEAIQTALGGAIRAPLDVMRACANASIRGIPIASFGNPSAASDVQVGLELLLAGLRGAKLNVDINLASVKDAASAAAIREEVARLERAAVQAAADARARLSG
jgi:formiminotetrahydrofolate cyclodeaminase